MCFFLMASKFSLEPRVRACMTKTFNNIIDEYFKQLHLFLDKTNVEDVTLKDAKLHKQKR